MGKTINYSCPNCGATILHEVDDKGNGSEIEFCASCQRSISLSELQNAAFTGAGNGYSSFANAGDAMVTYIDDSESAFAYLENLFETYDWDSFNDISALTIPDVDKMVDKMLIKNAAKSATWELKFTSIATPLQKKISGLKKLEAKFFEAYVEKDDLADCFVFFDTYSKIVNNIISGQDNIIKNLDSAIKFYKRYSKSDNASVVKSMTAQLDAIKKDIASLKQIKDYRELPGFAKAHADKQARIARKLAEKNIDAEQVYNTAMEEGKKGGDVRRALSLFNKIKGYKNASENADRLNAYLNFPIADGTFIKLGRKHYIYREQQIIPLNIAPTKKGFFAKLFNKNSQNENPEEQPVQDNKKRWEMFEITDKKQAEKSCVKKLTCVVKAFGGHLIYIKDNADLCIFDSNAPADKAESVLLSAKKGDILQDKMFVRDDKLFFAKKLDTVKDEKLGCLAKLLKKPAKQTVLTLNNYSLLSLDLVTNQLETVVPEMVDIQEVFGEELFFTKVTSVDDNDPKEEFFSYNYMTKRVKSVLSADTEILNVVDGKVIYFVWTPNDYNKDLHALDLQTGADVTLDCNVFDYYGVIEDKIYYYVGNDERKTLYRIATDGSDKMEISNNASFFDRVIRIRNGWIYFINGFGSNATLVKMRTDGKDYIPLCPRFQKLVEIRDGYVYYIDKRNVLCCAREDGKELTPILGGIGNFIQVTRDAIYLLRKEVVDEDSSRKLLTNNSLYKVNLEGKGLEKIAFDITNAITNSFDKNEIYLYRTDKITYSIAKPIDKKEYETTYEIKVIKTITIYDIANKTFKDVAVFGKPKAGKFEIKGGCLKKNVSKDAIIKEVPNKKTFKRSGRAKAGEVAGEQTTPSSPHATAKNPSVSESSKSGKLASNLKSKFVIASKGSIVGFAIALILFIVGIAIVPDYNEKNIVGNIFLRIFLTVALLVTTAYNGSALNKDKKQSKKWDLFRCIALLLGIIGIIVMISGIGGAIMFGVSQLK